MGRVSCAGGETGIILALASLPPGGLTGPTGACAAGIKQGFEL